ncbi:hypothetical protein C2E23DRAFT_890817 [Lenzites betulinus]|nr:hypothetical protein C2E23DRAFT_890817 [Lenzites betulinus]
MSIFPFPGTYAVVEIDVARTLRCLDDPSASAAGAAMKITKCLVYVDVGPGPCFANYTTTKYRVYVIGPRLRPEDPARDLVSDMCVPLHPNTSHPFADRAALKPSPAFPFANCYQWFGPDMVLNVRTWDKDRSFSAENVTSLPAGQQMAMETLRGDDLWRSARAREDRDGTPMPVFLNRMPIDALFKQDKPANHSSSLPCADDASAIDPCPGQRCDSEGQNDPVNSPEWYPDASCSSFYVPSDDADSFAVSYDDSPEANVVRVDYVELDELVPVVKMWPDISAHFTEEDVPDPVEFLTQYDEVVRILKESKARAKLLHAAEQEHSNGSPPVEYAGSSSGDSMMDDKQKRPGGFWTRLARASSFFICVQY